MTLSSVDEAIAEINAGALVVSNHSGGKDSQAMLIRLLAIVPRRQLMAIHADLSSKEQIEWPGTREHAEKQARDAGVAIVIAEAEKTLLSMVENRHATRPSVPSWPSSSTRQCTSDLKRGPIEREIRRYMKEHGFSRVISAMGMRAEESPNRAKKETWRRNDGNSKAGRIWYDWLPIHKLTTEEVFKTIEDAGQQPHPAYARGNERLSCVFCILSSKNDLRNGAVHNPDLYKRYVELEQRTGYTAHQSRKGLPEITGLTIEQAYEEHRRLLVIQ